MYVADIYITAQTASSEMRALDFTIPAKQERREAWLRSISRAGWEAKSFDRLCGEHFVSGRPSRDPIRTSITYPHSSRMASGERIAVYPIETGKKGARKEPRCAKTKRTFGRLRKVCCI